MTAKNKRVKTHWMATAFDVAAGTTSPPDTENNALLLWTPQDDITIIGCELWTELVASAELDSGKLLLATEFSTVGRFNTDGLIAQLQNAWEARSVTVGAFTSEVALGIPINSLVMMFPEGYGIDVEALDTLYMNCYQFNSMANSHRVSPHILVYYVER